MSRVRAPDKQGCSACQRALRSGKNLANIEHICYIIVVAQTKISHPAEGCFLSNYTVIFMTRIQLAILLGILGGISSLILVSQKISNPTTIWQAGNCQVSERYPENVRRWCNPIQKNAVEHGLDPNLVAAVMLQESGGNPQAYSKSGAVGLMQVMPRNGIAAQFMCNGNPCFTNRPSMSELYNPEFNIEYGTNMLSGLNSKYGNLRDALKAYGPMDVGYRYADIVLEIYYSYR